MLGATHPDKADSERQSEWRKINNLRHDIFHSLQDSNKLRQQVRETLPATMHYLHDAICCLSHSHDLESNKFQLARGMKRVILLGTFTSSKLEPLEKCQTLLDIEQGYIVPHPQHGFVPEFKIQYPGLDNFRGYFFWLDELLENATIDDLIPARYEDNK